MLKRLLALLVIASPLAAQTGSVTTQRTAAVAGVVRDTLGHPLKAATIYVEGKDLSSVSDDSGRFHIAHVPAGKNVVTAIRIGYKAVSFELDLPPDSTIVTEIRLRSVQTLRGVNVTGERVSPRLARDGFYSRLKQGWGSFLTPDKVEELQHLSTPAQMLRDVKGVQVRCPSTGRCSVSPTVKQCLNLFVNGVRTAGQMDDVLGTSEVYAVEVYSGSVPLEFQGMDGRCGAIVVWTVTHSAP